MATVSALFRSPICRPPLPHPASCMWKRNPAQSGSWRKPPTPVWNQRNKLQGQRLPAQSAAARRLQLPDRRAGRARHRLDEAIEDDAKRKDTANIDLFADPARR